MAETLWSIVAVIGGLLMVVVLLYFLFTGHGDRDKEEAAREYYDEHGYWPDEAPSQGL